MDEFFLKEMRTCGQPKISSHCFCVWCESTEPGSSGISRFPCVTLVVETSSDRVKLRIPSNINDGAPAWKQPRGLTHVCLRSKAPPQTSYRIPNADPTRGAINFGVDGLQVQGIGIRSLVYKDVLELRWNYKKSYFWWLGNPACGNSTGVTGLKKKVEYLLNSLRKGGGGAVWFSVWNAFRWLGSAGLCWCLIHTWWV